MIKLKRHPGHSEHVLKRFFEPQHQHNEKYNLDSWYIPLVQYLNDRLFSSFVRLEQEIQVRNFEIFYDSLTDLSILKLCSFSHS
jgi:hypothetical protein